MAPSSKSTTVPPPGRRPPFQLHTSSSSRKASNPSLSLVYASPDPSLPVISPSSSNSRCEEALSRQLDGDLGGKQMGLRSRRSSTATLRTINTQTGAAIGGGAQSPRESIAEEEEEPDMTIHMRQEASGSNHVSGREQNMELNTVKETKGRLNPKASSSWLRWNSSTPSFPRGKEKGKGKEKELEGERTPGRRASTVGNGGEVASPEAMPDSTLPSTGDVVGSSISAVAEPTTDPGDIPPPSDPKVKGWFSKNPPPPPPASTNKPEHKAVSPQAPTQQESNQTHKEVHQGKYTANVQGKGQSHPDDAPLPSGLQPGLEGPASSDAHAESSAAGGTEGSAKPEAAGAAGWKEYLTWGRKGAARPPIPTEPEPQSQSITNPKPASDETNDAQVIEPQSPLVEVSDDVPPPAASAQKEIADEVSVAPSVQEATAPSGEPPRQTWGSFLYGIVVPQVGEIAAQSPPTVSDTGTSQPVAPTSPTAEQPPVHVEPTQAESISAEETSPAPAVGPVAEDTKLKPATGASARKGSQASTTAGWLNYLAFRASQKKVENPASSVMTSDTAEVMDFSNDPNFPAEPSIPPNKPTANNSGMRPPAQIPDKKKQKRLSASSIRSATSVVPIPPSPQRTTLSTPAPSHKASALPPPPQVPATQPNLVIPSFSTTFDRPPRSFLPPKPPAPAPTAQPGLAWRALGAVGSYVYPGQEKVQEVVEGDSKETRGRKEGREIGTDLPRRIGLNGEDRDDGWKNVKRVVVVGVHGWFPAKIVNSVIGEPTGTSSKFANMMGQAVRKFFDEKGVDDIRLTLIPLEGEGTIEHRIDRLYKSYLSNPAWINDLRRADAIFFAAHSQGCIVTTHLISRLIAQGHIKTPLNAEAVARCSWAFGPVSIVPPSEPRNPKSRQAHTVPVNVEEGGYQKVCMLAMCGVHQGPLYSIGTSTVIQPYLQWFENPAARELFEFQETTSAVSQAYQRALAMVLENEVRVVLLSSLNDQVVPIYGSSFSAVSHPLLLRALFVDGASYSASDFMTNLLCFSFMLRNAGISDQHLIEHLSEATAGSLTGLGHSTPYEEPASFALAVEYLFHSAPLGTPSPELMLDHFSAREGRNDFELPWIMRALVDSPEIKDLFPGELKDLKEGVLHWKPTTKALKDIKKKLEPMAGRQSKLGQLRSSPSSASLASGVEPGSPAGTKLLAPPAGKPTKSRL